MTCDLRLTLPLEPEETNQPNGNIMNSQFDEMTKGLDKSATRRAALKKFGVGLAVALLFASQAATLPQVVSNGGFENPILPDQPFVKAIEVTNTPLTLDG